MRDVARSVCALDARASAVGETLPSMLILDHIVGACDTAVRGSPEVLPPETAVHILSSLAKPLNRLGKNYQERPSVTERAIVRRSLLALHSVCDQLISSFESHSLPQILPLSRLALMATASLSPLFGSLAMMKDVSDTEKDTITTFKRTLLASLHHSLLSTANIPELMAESTLSGDLSVPIHSSNSSLNYF